MQTNTITFRAVNVILLFFGYNFNVESVRVDVKFIIEGRKPSYITREPSLSLLDKKKVAESVQGNDYKFSP